MLAGPCQKQPEVYPPFTSGALHQFFRARVCYLSIAMVICATVIPVGRVRAGDVAFSDNFTSFYPDDNPWGCVDSQGQIKAIEGQQLVVDDSGAIGRANLSPSVAVGDLNGDGLPDLMVADAMGFFWYFQNHGTKTAPVFTTAEIMPIWLGDPYTDLFHQNGLVTSNVIPRIQLVDLNGQGKLDLVVGNYLGKLFCLPNQGTATSPAFKMPKNMDEITIPTERDGVLWCNYLAPFFYDWHHSGVLDLLIGDGSYSANSIYLLKNKGSNSGPIFSKEDTQKIIPGMGREQIVPQVVSWNEDGKADILATEREGYLNIFLNQTTDPGAEFPVFDQGHHVLVGGQEKLNQMPTATLADLMGSGLPGLVIATADGHISFSQNTGTPKDFQFGPPTPLKLTNSKPKILRPYNWTLDGGYGSPYDLLVCTNAQVEPKFFPPADPSITTALRFYRDEPSQPNPTFPSHFYPKVDTRLINRQGTFTLKADTQYKLSFWIKTGDDVRNIKYLLSGRQPDPNDPNSLLGITTLTDDVNASGAWELFSKTIRFESLSDDTHAAVPFEFHLQFDGPGSLYIAGIKLEEDD